MTPYYEKDGIVIYHGDCLAVMRELPAESVDSIVTDPPYGLSFMGKTWDVQVPSVEVWQECLRVLKPGGHLLSFAGTRTQHRMAMNIEDAGFEVRDMLCWVYGSGFPKSLDVSKAIDKMAGAERDVVGPNPNARPNRDGIRAWVGDKKGKEQSHPPLTAPATEAARQWEGWGTALKPSLEPITMARKPLTGTVAENVLEHGAGAINVDGCRVGTEAIKYTGHRPSRGFAGDAAPDSTGSHKWNGDPPREGSGRYPANLIHDGSDEVTGLFPQTVSVKAASVNRSNGVLKHGGENGRPSHGTSQRTTEGEGYDDAGSAARFFYCAKASKDERRKSKHPTVKPLDLMRYLVRLVTPVGATVLDPFAGSGTTIEAAMNEHCRCIGIEREQGYCDDAINRLAQGVLF